MAPKKRTSRKTEDDPQQAEGQKAAQSAEQPDAQTNEAANEANHSDATLAEREAQLEARMRELDERETRLQERDKQLDERAQGLIQSEDAFKAHVEEVEVTLQKKADAMLTTATMPGAAEKPRASAIAVSSPAEPPASQARAFKGRDLGKCDRTVFYCGSGPVHERMSFDLTFKPGHVYELVLHHGRGQVPQDVASYIQRENPGGSLRVD